MTDCLVLAPPAGLEPAHAACAQGRFALPLKRRPKTPAPGLLRHRCIAHWARSAPQQFIRNPNTALLWELLEFVYSRLRKMHALDISCKYRPKPSRVLP